MNQPKPHRSLPRRAASLLASAAVLAWLVGSASAAAPSAVERDVKAAYLCNLAHFVDWPAPASRPEAFRLLVVGDPEMAEALRQALAGRQLRGLPVKVLAGSFSEAPPECDLLYSARESRAAFLRLHAALGKAPTLTVGEGPDFLSAGGAISFRLEQQTVRLSICPENATRRGLSISSKLLRLCKIVKPER